MQHLGLEILNFLDFFGWGASKIVATFCYQLFKLTTSVQPDKIKSGLYD